MVTDPNDPGNPNNKARTRQAQAELRRLLLRWDPIGVADAPEAVDEYDCMIGPLMTRLRQGATSVTVAEWLLEELEEHFGLLGDPQREMQLATELVAWWQERSSRLVE